MTDHDPPPTTRPVPAASTAEEARRPALALLDRLYQASAITLEELTRGRSAILRGELDELLGPALGADAPPANAGSGRGAPPIGRSIGDYLRAGPELGAEAP